MNDYRDKLDYIESQQLPAPQAGRRDTEWLNGLRGIAALIVVFHHFGLAFWHQTAFAYATQLPVGFELDRQPYLSYAIPIENNHLKVTSDVQDNHSIFQLPILRLLVSGDPMVAIFFLVSGYSLSIKPISLMRQGLDGQSKLLLTLSSAAFRRPIRLLLPLIVSTLIVAVAAAFGLYAHAASYSSGPYEHQRQYYHGWVLEAVPPIKDTLLLQLADWFWSLKGLLESFTTKRAFGSLYDLHTWTIPTEFRCSYLLYMTQAATAQLSSKIRLALLSILILGAFLCGDNWEMALFWSGMFLSEFNVITDTRSLVKTNPSRPSVWAVRVFKAVILFIGLYLASMPTFEHHFSPLYAFFDSIHILGAGKPFSQRFWVAIGALMTFCVVMRTRTLKDFFSSRITRYLGRISFSLYLVHGPVLRGLGYSLAVLMSKLIGNDTTFRYNTAIVLTLALTLPVIFALSHLFCIAVDEPIVRMARLVEGRLKKQDHDNVEEWEHFPIQYGEEMPVLSEYYDKHVELVAIAPIPVSVEEREDLYEEKDEFYDASSDYTI
ncbi:hypothetical protein K461DRAFT_309245 [Myriangium duriaei CBS 260.36]|uniref:Acyltransferase 3 domain-containing protein n=1 Tax=Myriangium duriaei CBS 260.36 TaxID=1168546 RepID=A0A9P4J8L2_9PEZI|nr:hypothetical protein K461DRAFT_309245 [Myriangium duriaei CBS 260.36]